MDVMLVLAPGLSSTLQDHGRRGGLDSGIPPGGAADDYAYRLNCLVLGNPPGAAVVEHVLKGGRYEALAPVTVALTGADMAATVNGTSVPMAAPVTLKRGDLLETRVARRGCFGYLGVAGGGLAGTRVFGSASTYLDGQLGGLDGRALRAGDALGVESGRAARASMVEAPGEHAYLCSPPTQLRFTRGPQHEYFDDAAYGTFTAEPYRVSPRSNRVGYRIEGTCPAVRPVPRTNDTGSGPTDIIEEGNPVGGIQIAGGKEIICLGRDCGTSGAYAKIGCLIGADVSRLAQLAPGGRFRFAEVSPCQARSIRADYSAVLGEVARRAGHIVQPDPPDAGGVWHGLPAPASPP
jgi:antagonist of KipI